MGLADEMIKFAAFAGADYVKFQTWSATMLKSGPWDHDGRRQLYIDSELSKEDHFYLRSRCENANVKFLTSCFCPSDLEFIRELSSEVKIPSPECIDRDFVVKACDLFDRVFVSVGAMAYQEFEYLYSLPNVVVMHCVSSYPCSPENFHWVKFKNISSNKLFGYSGHMTGIWDAFVAISNGASFIEKHFTVDNSLPGRDNKFALLPEDFRQIREFADAFTLMQTEHDIYKILPCEDEYRRHHLGRWRGNV